MESANFNFFPEILKKITFLLTKPLYGLREAIFKNRPNHWVWVCKLSFTVLYCIIIHWLVKFNSDLAQSINQNFWVLALNLFEAHLKFFSFFFWLNVWLSTIISIQLAYHTTHLPTESEYRVNFKTFFFWVVMLIF